jgi:hypothetical protein
MGMPMILVEWPLMIVAPVPIIFAETLLIRRWILLPKGKAYVDVSLANLVSTLVGVPLSLALLLFDTGSSLCAYCISIALTLAASRYGP